MDDDDATQSLSRREMASSMVCRKWLDRWLCGAHFQVVPLTPEACPSRDHPRKAVSERLYRLFGYIALFL